MNRVPADPGSAPAPAALLRAKPAATLGGAIRAVSGVTFLSRLAGLVREVLIARIFGATAVGSAFLAGFAIPNMFRRLFGEGALSAAFIPEYTQAHKADPQAADRFASLTVAALMLVTTAIMVVVELGLLLAVLLLPANPMRELSLKLVMVMLPYMPLVCTAAILGGMLQVHGRYAPASSGPIILNSFVVAAGIYFLATGTLGGAGTAYILGLVTVLSGVTQCAWFLYLLRGHVRWSRAFADAHERGRVMLKRFIPAVIGMGTLQINTMLDTLIAMWPIWVGPAILGIVYPLDEASNIILGAAQRLYQFPLGVFGIAVATAVFPMLSRHADDHGAFLSTLRRGLRLSLFIGLPASIGLFLVRADLTAILYGFGSRGFTASDIARSSAALAGFAPGVWAYSLNHVLTRAFFARGDTKTPMRIAIAMVLFNLALNVALIWPLSEAGLAWATSISATVQLVVLMIVLGRAMQSHEPLIDGQTLRGALRVIAAGVLMGVSVWLAQRAITFPATWGGRLGSLVVAVGVGGISYLAFARLLRTSELAWLLKRGS